MSEQQDPGAKYGMGILLRIENHSLGEWFKKASADDENNPPFCCKMDLQSGNC